MPTYKFTGPYTLKFPVYEGKKCVLSAGTPNVEIAFWCISKDLYRSKDWKD